MKPVIIRLMAAMLSLSGCFVIVRQIEDMLSHKVPFEWGGALIALAGAYGAFLFGRFALTGFVFKRTEE